MVVVVVVRRGVVVVVVEEGRGGSGSRLRLILKRGPYREHWEPEQGRVVSPVTT